MVHGQNNIPLDPLPMCKPLHKGQIWAVVYRQANDVIYSYGAPNSGCKPAGLLRHEFAIAQALQQKAHARRRNALLLSS